MNNILNKKTLVVFMLTSTLSATILAKEYNCFATDNRTGETFSVAMIRKSKEFDGKLEIKTKAHSLGQTVLSAERKDCEFYFPEKNCLWLVTNDITLVIGSHRGDGPSGGYGVPGAYTAKFVEQEEDEMQTVTKINNAWCYEQE